MNLSPIDDLNITIVRKRIKNINLSVMPPDGLLRISAPMHVSDETIHAFIEAKINWIKRAHASIRSRTYQPTFNFESGEMHAYLGFYYELQLLEVLKAAGKLVLTQSTMLMTVKTDFSIKQRETVLNEFYRAQLKCIIVGLINQWQPIIGVKVNHFGIKKMKTRWGTCNIRDRRIWLNLELAKHPLDCLEYVVVHEMVHLLERKHNARFWGLLDQLMPAWKKPHQQLKQINLFSKAPQPPRKDLEALS